MVVSRAIALLQRPDSTYNLTLPYCLRVTKPFVTLFSFASRSKQLNLNLTLDDLD